MQSSRKEAVGVGPVLSSGPWAEGVLKALKEENPQLTVLERGSYQRVIVPKKCTLSRKVVLKHVSDDFVWPASLEMIMPSFEGHLVIEDERAIWREK